MPSVSRLSGQSIWVPVRVENPITGAVDLSAATMTIAITKIDPVSGDYSAATVENGTWTAPDGDVYYVATQNLTASSKPAGEYQVWVKIVAGAVTYVLRAGPLTIY